MNPATLSEHAHHWLAFSGGPDSLCLLHLLIQSGMHNRLSVVHIDHGMDPHSGERAAQASWLAEQLGVQCLIETLQPEDLDRPGGPEATARHARYSRLQALMSAGDYLLTAHHADDQIETVFLRLLRASGARGLSGMRAIRPFAPGWLARPLLHWSRQQILDHLQRHDLQAVTDPSNHDTSLDRNYLRHKVLPFIEQRWPEYRNAVLQSSELIDAAHRAFEQQAARDFTACAQTHDQETTILLEPWLNLETARALELIRHWCRIEQIDPPPANRLAEWLRQCQTANHDRQPLLNWHSAQLRRWAGALWLDHRPVPADDWELAGQFDAANTIDVTLPHQLGQYRLIGTSDSAPGKQWQIDSGRKGDGLVVSSNGPNRLETFTRSVTELMRTARVPPWRRNRWPRLRIDGRLAAIGERWFAHDFDHWLKEHKMQLEWVRN